jgi:threonyl-tRNA synthetase
LNAKIRDAQNEKIPYMLIVGDKEQKNQTVSERGRSGKDYGEMKIEDFLKNIKHEIATKALD